MGDQCVTGVLLPGCSWALPHVLSLSSVWGVGCGLVALRADMQEGSQPTPVLLPGGTGEPSPNGQLCLVVLGAKNLPVRSDGTLNSFVKG